MAISVIPPDALTSANTLDLQQLQALIQLLATILDNEALIPSADRTMTAGSIASLNNTLTDASDRIDATINPPAALP